jgi:hypothetical protein
MLCNRVTPALHEHSNSLLCLHKSYARVYKSLTNVNLLLKQDTMISRLFGIWSVSLELSVKYVQKKKLRANFIKTGVSTSKGTRNNLVVILQQV